MKVEKWESETRKHAERCWTLGAIFSLPLSLVVRNTRDGPYPGRRGLCYCYGPNRSFIMHRNASEDATRVDETLQARAKHSTFLSSILYSCLFSLASLFFFSLSLYRQLAKKTKKCAGRNPSEWFCVPGGARTNKRKSFRDADESLLPNLPPYSFRESTVEMQVSQISYTTKSPRR